MGDQDIFTVLRGFLGQDVRYAGTRWLLIDVLEEEAVVVLQSRSQVAPIQLDQFGRPARRAEEIKQIPVFVGDRNEMSSELLEILQSLRSL